MYAVRISDDLKATLDHLVAQGFAASPAEAIAQAVLRCAADSDGFDDVLSDSIDAGLADMRDGNYVTIDGSDSREAFWHEIARDGTEAVAPIRSRVAPPSK